jgi:hypothetical protein
MCLGALIGFSLMVIMSCMTECAIIIGSAGRLRFGLIMPKLNAIKLETEIQIQSSPLPEIPLNCAFIYIGIRCWCENGVSDKTQDGYFILKYNT